MREQPREESSVPAGLHSSDAGAWTIHRRFSMSAVTVQTHDVTGSRRWLVWTGRIVSVVPVLIVLMSSRWKLTSNPWYVHEWGRSGWKTPDLTFIDSLQLGAVLLYVIPRTPVLG